MVFHPAYMCIDHSAPTVLLTDCLMYIWGCNIYHLVMQAPFSDYGISLELKLSSPTVHKLGRGINVEFIARPTEDLL